MQADRANSTRLLIGDLILDAGQREVRRGDEKLALPRLSYRLLLVLAEAAPDVVSHDVLADKVWSGRIVGPETISQRVKLLRKALGDDASHPRYIGLHRGVGYRLLPEIQVLPPDESDVTRGLLVELRRRRILPIALMYIALAWSLSALTSIILDELYYLPRWTERFVALTLIGAFPVAMWITWRYDLLRGGARRTGAGSRNRAPLNVAASTLLICATSMLAYLVYPASAEAPSRNTADLSARLSEATPNSLAVLPFVDLSDDVDDLYLSEGLSSGLREQLVQVGGLRVAARSSSVQFGDKAIDAVEIARRLGVENVVEGTVRRDADRLLISVQLIDGETGFQTWADRFDGTRRDLPVLQQRIAEQVITRILPQRTQSGASLQPATTNAAAHELLWVAGLYYQQVRQEAIVDVDTLEKAIELYRQTIAIDSGSAQAHSRLGAALLYLGDVTAAEQPIFKALSINPDLSEVQYTLGLYYWKRFLPGTGEAYKRAVELNRYNADALEAYGKWIWHQMIYDEPEQYLIGALEVDPMAINRYADLGNYYGMSGMRDKARAVATRILERFADPNAYMVTARILELTGDLDESIAWAVRAHELQPENPAASWMLAELYARIGDFDTARQYEDKPAFNLLYWERRYQEMIDLGEELVIEQPQVQLWYGLARAYNAMGNYQQAARALRSQDIPQRAFNENRRANDQEALISLADALNKLGETERAHELADWMNDKFDLVSATGGDASWWYYLYSACTSSILQQYDVALDRLEAMMDVNGMPWYPVLIDSPCFRALAHEPRYQAVIESVETQKRRIRMRLPETLAEFAKASRIP